MKNHNLLLDSSPKLFLIKQIKVKKDLDLRLRGIMQGRILQTPAGFCYLD